ncbi:hypothetical protein PT974_07590 [Cladobotryum mycophilum]|uniref:Uncharacterized protein n=1 Tax=Cladobotryum mycophilum TaxID=491253 RepID=A0ABR0SPP5_9HYPO
MATNNDNVTPAGKNERIVVTWMINDTKGGFQEPILSSKGGPPQFVSISKSDAQNNKELKGLPNAILSSATIDRQGVINVPIGKTQVPFVNVQAQVGSGASRHTYSHVNVVADKRIGVALIRDALNQSLETVQSLWIVETAPNTFHIQANRPA